MTEDSYSVLRGVSKVPRLTGGGENNELRRWDIRVQSTNLEHMVNGINTRLHFNVIPSVKSNDELPSGIDFSVSRSHYFVSSAARKPISKNR